MAWNEPGGNNQDPWGGGNKGDKQGPPDLDDAFRKFQEKLNSMFGGGRKGGGGSGGGAQAGSSSGIFIGILILAVAAYIWNAVYTVDEKSRPSSCALVSMQRRLAQACICTSLPLKPSFRNG